MQQFVPDDAVRPCEVDVLEDAEGIPLLLHRLRRVKAVAVDDDHFAGLDFPHEFGAEVVEGAGLGGDDPALTD